jgi:hypothetical protein
LKSGDWGMALSECIILDYKTISHHHDRVFITFFFLVRCFGTNLKEETIITLLSISSK